MDVVPGTREQSEDGTLDAICESFAVSGGNQPVAVSPTHQDRWETRDFVSTLQEQAALATPVDDVANASSERTRRSFFGVDRTELGDLRVGAQPAKRQACSVSHEGLPEALDGEGERSEPQRQADVAAETSGGEEYEAPHSLRAFEQQHLSDTSAEGMTDDIRSLDPDGSEPLGDQARVPGKLVTGVGALGSPVSWKIRHEYAAIGREGGGDVFPREVRIVETMKQDEWYRTPRPIDFGPVQPRACDGNVRVSHFDRTKQQTYRHEERTQSTAPKGGGRQLARSLTHATARQDGSSRTHDSASHPARFAMLDRCGCNLPHQRGVDRSRDDLQSFHASKRAHDRVVMNPYDLVAAYLKPHDAICRA